MSIDWKSIRPYEGSQHSAFEELVCQIAYNKFHKDGRYTRVKAPDGGVESYLILPNGDEIGWQAKYFFDIQDAQLNQIEKSFKTAIKKHPNLNTYYVCCPIDKQDPRLEDRDYLQDRWNKFVEKCKVIANDAGISVEIEYWGAFEFNNELQKSQNAGMAKFWFGGDDFSDEWFKQQVDVSIKNLGARYSTELNFENHDIATYFDTVIRNKNFKNDVFTIFQSLLEKVISIYDAVKNSELDKSDVLFQHCEELVNKIKVDWHSISSNGLLSVDFEKIPSLVDAIRKRTEELITNKAIKDEYGSVKNDCWKLSSVSYDFKNKHYYLANNPYLIIHGDAGIGKSHLLGDLAHQLIIENKKCVFILGQRLMNKTNPWTQILKDELRLSCNEYEFLGVLNTIGHAQQERVLLIIDAINEGEGRQFWKDSLAGFITTIKNYPWVGLVLSVRTEYKEQILTHISNDIDNKLIGSIKHYGFETDVIDAVEYFFNYYQIPLPTEPLLIDEFRNPLFLKIYCEYRQKNPQNNISTTITEIFKQYFKHINSRIVEKLGYRGNQNFVSNILDTLAEHIFLANGFSIDYNDAYKIIDKQYERVNAEQFLQELIAENLLTAQTNYTTDTEYLHFSFERFFDYFTAKFICDKLTTKEEFKNNLIYKYNNFEYQGKFLSQGVTNILAVLVPITYKFELYEIADLDSTNYHYSLIDAFINGLYWRDNHTFNLKQHRDFINTYIVSYDSLFSSFINLMYQVAGKENHPLNADYLHAWLSNFSLAQRDAFWTIEMGRGIDVLSSLDVLINWAKNRGFSASLSEKSRLLIATALSWVLATTNIALRDNATISISRLLQNNLTVAKDVLIRFSAVNDPYIVERVYASVYGAVLTSKKLDGLSDICDFLINEFFTADEIYPNVLVRDYAKNIVEYAHFKNVVSLTADENKLIRPPYNSSLPSSFPSNDDIDAKYNNYDGKEKLNYHYSIDSIFSSMTTEYGRGVGGYGDFGRYTFQSNFDNWEEQIDIDLLSNYAIQFIFEKYGYDAELHGEFDRGTGSSLRDKNTVERIGKKYQWIAMYEVMARVADNVKMIDPSTNYNQQPKQEIWYNGSIKPCLRDIDPSFIMPKNDVRLITTTKYDDWGDDFEAWVVSKDNLVDIKQLIINEYDGKDWLSLQRHVDYKPEHKLEENTSNRDYQNFWYRVQACLVRKDDFEEFKNNIQNKSFMNKWMPQPKENYSDINYGEYHWSPLFSIYESEYYGEREWQSVSYGDYKNRKVLGEAYSCCDSYTSEGARNSDLQCSTYIPSKLVYESLHLKNDACAGSWLNQDNEMVMFNASLYGNDQGNLLITHDELIRLEKESDCRVIWTVLAEKVAMYGMSRSTEKCLGISGVYYLEDGKITGDDYFVVT